MAPDPVALSTRAFAVEPASLVVLPPDERPYERPIGPVLAPPPADATGLPLFEREGRRYDHPVLLAQAGIAALVADRRPAGPGGLELARRAADRLVTGAVEADGALWLPYRFAFELHGRPAERLDPPWYSAMAQGQALSLVSRLAARTGDPADLGTATRLAASFGRIGTRDGPWVSHVTPAERHLWLEEYPSERPDFTLNGFVFAVFGLYDYWLLGRDAAAERLIAGALTTLRGELAAFRTPGGLSVYCLAHRVRSAKYHAIHVDQLRLLAALSGDRTFATLADRFEADPSSAPPIRRRLARLGRRLVRR